jgi:VWFA-related protein
MKRPSSRLLAAVRLFPLCFSIFASQEVMPQTDNSTTPTFRATTHLILLDVVVTDKNGNPIQDLRKEDFSIRESGIVQKIANLTRPEVVAAPRAGEILAPGVFSNSPLYRLAGAVPTVVVLDAANTSFKNQVYGRNEMLRYLKHQYKPGQRLAIFSLTDRLRLMHDFTSDPAVLIVTLEKIVPAETSLPRTTGGTEDSLNALRFASEQQYKTLVAAFEKFQTSEARYSSGRRSEVTLEAMRRITRMLGGLPGRKNIIWLSAGFPFTLIPELSISAKGEFNDFFSRSPSLEHAGSSSLAEDREFLQRGEYDDEVRQISALMATSQVAIYPVDVRGLSVTGPMDVGEGQETLREVARETGGRAFVNRNDVENGIALAQRDQAATYTIAYYSTNKASDHKYRAIDLKVDRAGVETVFRRGYFVVDDTRPTNDKLDRLLTESWQDGAPDTLVSFEAKVTPSEKGKIRVDFLVDPSSLSVGEEGSGKRFDVAFYIASVSPTGKILKVQKTKLERVFPIETYKKIMQEGMRLHIDADELPDSSELQLAVQDNRTGYIGSLRAPVTSK